MENTPGKPPPHFLVFIPGYMGSRLRSKSTGKTIWLDIPRLIQNPFEIGSELEQLFKEMRYPNDDLEPDGVMDQLIFLPTLFKQEQYIRLIDIFTEWGYHYSESGEIAQDPAIYSFAYDWRQDNRLSARILAKRIETLKQHHPGTQAWIIAHSNGGIIARWYIEKEGGKDHVSRLFLLASPWDGAPKSIQVLQNGLDIFFLRLFNRYGVQELLRQVALTFPSFYQLIPAHLPFLQEVGGKPYHPFKDTRWLENPEQQQKLADAFEFYRELGVESSVETLCFFGIKQPTVSRGIASLSIDGKIEEIRWSYDEEGDGTIPIHSALHPQAAQKLPYAAGHGDLYIYPALLDKLKFELINRYVYGALAAVSLGRVTARFESDSDAYTPGQTIHVWAQVLFRDTRLPIFEARVSVRAVYKVALPDITGQPIPTVPHSETPTIVLEESGKTRGFYEGNLPAPMHPGYYDLIAVVQTKYEPAIEIKEMILVDQDDAVTWS